MATAVFCIAETRGQVESIVYRLRVAGFSGDEISVLLPAVPGTGGRGSSPSQPDPELAFAAGSLGKLTGIGTLRMSDVGPVLAAGPVMARLNGLQAGASPNGLRRSLVAIGLPHAEARRYAGELTIGHSLVAAHAGNTDKERIADAIFREAGARHIAALPRHAEVELGDPSEPRGAPDVG